MAEIRKLPRTLIMNTAPDGFWAEVYLLTSPKGRPALVIGSWGGGWDHVSVSYSNRTPTWEEMAEVKDMFFHPDEVCVQYHPAESEYVNYHKHCLHIWKPQAESVPFPPHWMVGPRDRESILDVKCAAESELKRLEAEAVGH